MALVTRRNWLELADVVRAHGETLRQNRVLRPEQHAALRAVERCRTAVLGGYLDVVAACAWLVIGAFVNLLLSFIMSGPPGLRLATNGFAIGIPLFVGSLVGYASRQDTLRR